jgi:hypothetical protein
MTVVQGQITTIRDSIQQGRARTIGRPLGFAAEASADSKIDAAFEALGYNAKPGDPKSPFPVKAPPAPALQHPTTAVWAQAFGDYETRSGNFNGVDIGRNIRTGGLLGGADVTFPSISSASDAAVLGLLVGDIAAYVHNNDGSTARVNGPSVGAYAMYVNGGFSVDGTGKVDFLNLGQTTAGIETGLGLDNYTVAGNVNYKQDLGAWWWEPTAGASYTRTVWNSNSQAMGMTNGTDWRVQGGARFGRGFDWNGKHFNGTLTVLAYDDVSITGGTIVSATMPLAPTDQGKVFGQVIGKLETALAQNLSGYVEGEVRGRQNIFGAAGRIGLRYAFQ